MNPTSKKKKTLSLFKTDLLRLDTLTIVRKHLLFGDTYSLPSDQYFELRREVADGFEIHPSEVIMVGSGKIGFSIVPTKRYRPFSDTSDIDLALLAPILFDEIWDQVYEFDHQKNFWPQANQFKKYFFRGWIRPDLLPNSKLLPLGNRWFDFFRLLTNSRKYGGIKISAALYKNWKFLESYQAICVNQCIEEIKAGK